MNVVVTAAVGATATVVSSTSATTGDTATSNEDGQLIKISILKVMKIMA